MKRLPFKQAAIYANEVGNPTILATFTVIAAILPMAFVSGMMGPYMSPMPIGAFHDIPVRGFDCYLI
jgi:multidrug efflux pump subunit AcrB